MQCQKTHTFWNSFSKTYMYYVPIRLNDLYLPSKFYMDRTFEMIRYFCHFCCLLLLHTEPWPGCLGDTAAAPPLSQPLPSCWGVYPLSTKKSHSMTTDKHVPVHLPQMFIGTHKKTFCFCILKIVTFTSSKVQNKCNFNQNPFKNSIKKIHQKSAFF